MISLSSAAILRWRELPERYRTPERGPSSKNHSLTATNTPGTRSMAVKIRGKISAGADPNLAGRKRE